MFGMVLIPLLPRNYKLIVSTRTQLQALWECVDGITLHC